MFARVLVANRGEIAVRVIRAIHELGAEAVAVYSTADRDALHVRLADRAVCIGPPSASDSYLRVSNVIAAAETTGCEAVHPGYGFLSENPAFVRACDENDLVFVGPDADVMERMGDKARAKAEMRAAGVPLVPGTDGGATLAEVRTAAAIRTSARDAPPSVPGTSGTPAAFISALARALSPIRSITSASGPTKTRSLSSHARTNEGFSERKP